MKKYFIIMLIAGFALASCLKDKTVEPVVIPEGPCADTVFFQTEVLTQIFDVSCNTAGCHNAATATAGYTFETYDQIASNSTILLRVINHEDGVAPMPSGQPKLADSLIQKFDCWITQGKLNN